MLIYNHVSQTTSCDGKHVEEYSAADAYVAFQRNHSAFNYASYIYSKLVVKVPNLQNICKFFMQSHNRNGGV